MRNILLTLVASICLLSFALTVFRNDKAPACFNADEAAFGYSAYSILKTGKDEYGTFLPLRLKSFGDYKMPLYSYLSVPFMSVFGLTETGARALNATLSLLLPFIVYFLAQALFKNPRVSLLAAFLAATSLGLHIVARHAHEAYLATVLISTSLLFFIRTLKRPSPLNIGIFSLFLLLSLFAYQSSRIFAVFFFIAACIYFIRKELKSGKLILCMLLVIGAFAVTDILYNPVRVKNLLLFNSRGFSLNIQELKTEGGVKLLYNDLFQGIKGIAFQHLTYLSPQYFVTQGDENPRFGYKGLSLITPIEFLLIFIGLYYLYRNKQEYRHLITALFLFTPLSASLSWNDMSLTRSLFLLIPTLLIGSYGAVNLYNALDDKKLIFKYGTSLLVLGAFLFFLALSWDFYLFHYPKRGLIVRSWQCGYKELGSYVKNTYDQTDKYYITTKNGQPYIFMLYYLGYDPAKYQKQAKLSPPDQYGFGQVEGFDKFKFAFQLPEKDEKAVTVGFFDDFPEEFKKDNGILDAQITPIKVGTEDMFLIYDSRK